jgi:hypothetical protein
MKEAPVVFIAFGDSIGLAPPDPTSSCRGTCIATYDNRVINLELFGNVKTSV